MRRAKRNIVAELRIRRKTCPGHLYRPNPLEIEISGIREISENDHRATRHSSDAAALLRSGKRGESPRATAISPSFHAIVKFYGCLPTYLGGRRACEVAQIGGRRKKVLEFSLHYRTQLDRGMNFANLWPPNGEDSHSPPRPFPFTAPPSFRNFPPFPVALVADGNTTSSRITRILRYNPSDTERDRPTPPTTSFIMCTPFTFIYIIISSRVSSSRNTRLTRINTPPLRPPLHPSSSSLLRALPPALIHRG